jgi:replicative DNA helicase
MQDENNQSLKRSKKPVTEQSLLQYGKILPQAVDTEEVILGALMIDKDALSKIIGIITKPDIFYKEGHQSIFKAILELFEERIPIDIIIVTNKLKSMGKLDIAGGPVYISSLTGKVFSSANIQYHARIVLQKYLQREIIRICGETSNKMFEDTEDLFDAYESLVDQIKALGISKEEVLKAETIQETTIDLFSEMEETAKVDSVNFYSSRSKDMTTMFQYSPGNIILFGGKSGSAKTTLMADEIFGLVENNPKDISVLWYSMEDIPKNLIRQYIAREIKLRVKQLSNIGYKMSKEEIAEAKSYQTKLMSFDIDFRKGQTNIKTIKNSFYQFKEKKKDELKGRKHMFILAIDNILTLSDHQQTGYGKNQTSVDDYVCSVIKSIYDDCKDDSIIWLIHHLGKDQIDKRGVATGYRPLESDLKGSEGYARISTQIALINRPGAKEFADLLNEYKDTDLYETLKRIIIIETIKNRIIGNTGIIHRLCELDYKYFEDLSINIK